MGNKGLQRKTLEQKQVKCLKKGQLNSLISANFCQCAHISKFKHIDRLQCDCFNYLLHGDVAQNLSLDRSRHDEIFNIIRKRVDFLIEMSKMFPVYFYFDNDNKDDDFLDCKKERHGEEKAKEDIIVFAKGLLKGYGCQLDDFPAVLRTADQQMRYDYMRWTLCGELVVSLSFDNDFAVFGHKVIRLDPQNENGKNGIVGYIDLENIKMTKYIKDNQALQNLIKISRNRVKAAILYALIETFQGKDISIETVISIAVIKDRLPLFDTKLKEIQHFQNKEFKDLRNKILNLAAEKHLCGVVYNSQLGMYNYYNGLRFCHPVLAATYRKFKGWNVSQLKKVTGPRYKIQEYLTKVRANDFKAIEIVTPNLEGLKNVRKAIKAGIKEEGYIGERKYRQIPCPPSFLVRDKYLYRISQYNVEKDFFQREESTNESILTEQSEE